MLVLVQTTLIFVVGEDALFENIIFSNIVIETRVAAHEWWGRGEPIYLSVTPWHADAPAGYMHNITFTNILCRSENGVYAAADVLGQISDIRFDHVRVELSHWSRSTHPEEAGGWYDRRPTCDKDMELYKPREGIAGFHFENLRKVRVTNCEVLFADKQDYWGNAVYARGCEDLRIDVEGEAGQASLAAIDIE